MPTDDDRQIQVWAIIALVAFLVVAAYSYAALTGIVEPVNLPWSPEGLA